MRSFRRRLAMTAAVVVLVGGAGACGGDDDDDQVGGDSTEETVDDGGGDGSGEDAADEDLQVDNCTLLTNEEVSGLAGAELEASEDSMLGCAWVVPGEVVADFTLDSFRSDQSALDHGAELAPSAEVIELDGVGDEAVALAVDGSVNFIVAKQGDLGVVLVTTFLDVTPDSPALDAAGELAVTALGRLADAT